MRKARRPPISGAFWLASVLHFYSGQPLHNLSGVDIPQSSRNGPSQTAIRQAAFGNSESNSQKSIPVSETRTQKKKRSNWLLWWRIDQAELDKQVAQYGTLGFIHSARGAAVLCLALSGTMTIGFAYFGALGLDSTAYIDVALFGVLALFIYLGHRWATLCAMVLWTIEKVVFIIQGFGPAHPSPGMAIGQVLWWAAYMHAFYFAFRVEQKRKARSGTAAALV